MNAPESRALQAAMTEATSAVGAVHWASPGKPSTCVFKRNN